MSRCTWTLLSSINISLALSHNALTYKQKPKTNFILKKKKNNFFLLQLEISNSSLFAAAFSQHPNRSSFFSKEGKNYNGTCCSKSGLHSMSWAICSSRSSLESDGKEFTPILLFFSGIGPDGRYPD